MDNKIENELVGWVKSVVIPIIIVIGVRFIVQPTIVNGESMYPTLESNDYLFINKLAYVNDTPKRGDIVVFKTDLIDIKSNKKKKLIKRVIALPGEHIVIRSNEVYINGDRLNETYIEDVYTVGGVDMVVPKNSVFVMGDNRPDSLDSRSSEVGTVSLGAIIGKVFVRLYPFNKIGSID